MRIILISILFALVACQKRQSINITSEFEPYVASFALAYGGPIPALSVNFSPISSSGQCHIGRDDFNRIVKREVWVNKDHWDRFGETERKAVIWHELGHCVLMRSHTSGGSISYMAEYFGRPTPEDDLSFLYKYQITLDRELFGR